MREVIRVVPRAGFRTNTTQGAIAILRNKTTSWENPGRSRGKMKIVMKDTFRTLITTVAILQSMASAQQPANEPATQLPELIVVAEKEPDAAQSIPVSVTAVTKETIDNDNIRTVKDASVDSPDVFMNEFTARKLSDPFFRGIGSSPANPGVTTLLDGVPQLNANSSSIELLDVDQVEFVRGSQGTLYGRDTVGGLINVTSGSRPHGLARGLEGNYGNYEFQESACP